MKNIFSQKKHHYPSSATYKDIVTLTFMADREAIQGFKGDHNDSTNTTISCIRKYVYIIFSA